MPEPNETQTPRHDPPAASVDGHLRADEFTGKAKDRHYVCVHKGNPNQMAYYGALGYVVETYRKGGPRPRYYKGSADGTEIEVMGHVLMSCPLVEQEARERAVWARAQRIDDQILQPGGPDALRGIRGLEIKSEIHLDQ